MSCAGQTSLSNVVTVSVVV